MFCNYFHCCYIQSETKPPSAGAVSPVTFGVRSGMATGTRSTRQMEELMGTLLTTLQEQGQRQEQLAREQANHAVQFEIGTASPHKLRSVVPRPLHNDLGTRPRFRS